MIPSLLAQVIGLWAFQFAVKEAFIKSAFLVIVAAFFQPLQGMQIFILLSSFYIYQSFVNNKIRYQKVLYFFLIWLLTAGFYIFKLTTQYNICSPQNALLFADILEFRAAHHYFPMYFGLKNYIIVLPLLLFGFFYFSLNKNSLSVNKNALLMVRIIFWIVTIGISVYCIGVQVFRSKMVLSTQWFATTIWLQFFSVIGLVVWIEKFCINFSTFQKMLNKNHLSILFFGISGFFALLFTTPQYRVFSQKNYDLPFQGYKSEKNPNFWEIDIAQQVNQKTNKDAIFVTLTDATYFKYFSERSHFVDYKAIAHNCEAFTIWYEKIKMIYQINLENRRKKQDLPPLANQHFQQMTEKYFLELKEKQGITHILTNKNHLLNFKIIALNKYFKVYELSEPN